MSCAAVQVLGVNWGMNLVTPSLSQIFQSPVVPQLPEAAYSPSPEQGTVYSRLVAAPPLRFIALDNAMAPEPPKCNSKLFSLPMQQCWLVAAFAALLHHDTPVHWRARCAAGWVAELSSKNRIDAT